MPIKKYWDTKKKVVVELPSDFFRCGICGCEDYSIVPNPESYANSKYPKWFLVCQNCRMSYKADLQYPKLKDRFIPVKPKSRMAAKENPEISQIAQIASEAIGEALGDIAKREEAEEIERKKEKGNQRKRKRYRQSQDKHFARQHKQAGGIEI